MPSMTASAVGGGQSHEHSLLLPSSSAVEDELSRIPEEEGGSASASQTIINMTKTCMGTGCLALPYAAREGGFLLYTFGLAAIALWNVYATKRLCDCFDLIYSSKFKEHHTENSVTTSVPCDKTLKCCNPTLREISTVPPPPRGTATLGKLAWYALGPPGLATLDILTVLLLIGIIVAYIDAIRTFLQGTLLTTGNDSFDAILIACLIAPLSVVPDLGALTKTSSAGLFVLGFALLIITGYGIYSFSDDVSFTIHWFPRNGLAGFSHWFGCIVFGFGTVPLTFNFKESMAESKTPVFVKANLLAMLIVAAVYIIVGISLLFLYPGIESDVLSEIPEEGILPIVTRLAMGVVVMATAPLIIVPCGELLEGKLNNGEDDPHTRTLVRFGICFVTMGISVGVPGFVGAITFVGCFCVSLVSFCIPPFLYLVMKLTRGVSFRSLCLDTVMLVWGLGATGISTAYVLSKGVSKTA